MTNKIFKWIAIALFSCLLSGCYVKQRIVPFFIPKTQHDKFLDKVKYLEQNNVQVVLLGDTVRMLFPTDFFFYADSSEFRREKAEILWTAADVLNECGNAPVKVYGHTDDIGTNDHKLRRSYDWAFVIASYLWESGVTWKRMDVRGYADNQDIATFDTTSGSHFNRRVEVIMD